ncbi:MAG: hypothetical protein AAFY22_10115 [Pseudomonadota bacterium]
MSRTLKFLHTVGAIGFTGSMASLLVMTAALPDPAVSLNDYAAMRTAMAEVSLRLFLPSMAISVVAGLLSMSFTPAFQNAGWVFIKLASGVLIFEWSLVAIDGPIRGGARRTAEALSSGAGAEQLGGDVDKICWSLWVMMAVAMANIALGVWRPRLVRKKAAAAPAAAASASPAGER